VGFGLEPASGNIEVGSSFRLEIPGSTKYIGRHQSRAYLMSRALIVTLFPNDGSILCEAILAAILTLTLREWIKCL
jgi:hypothetical protein